jgi:hypothetical protein
MLLRLYSQDLTFYLTQELTQEARVRVPGKTFLPRVIKYSSFLGPFLSYEEEKVF